MLISHDGAHELDGLSRAQRERLVKADVYPGPVLVTAGRIAFVREEVEAWVRDRVAGRDQKRDPGTDPVLVATAGKTGLGKAA
jgi:predicted DNA-binding transcriptional regulator AlpA